MACVNPFAFRLALIALPKTSLDAQRQSLMKRIADLTAEAVSPAQMERISGYLETWETVSFEDKRLVADGLILTIKATSENIQIEWKI